MVDINTLIIFTSGVLAGFIGAQVGGGGLITLPTLLAMGLNPAVAIGTNRLAALFINFSAAIQYWRNKKISLKKIIPFTILAVIGSILGAEMVLRIDSDLLMKAITTLLIFLVLIVLYKKEIGTIEQEVKMPKKYIPLLILTALFLGAYAGSIGVAATTFIATLFIFQGQNFIKGMANAILITAITSISSLIVFILHDAIVYELAIPQGIGAFIGGWIGSKIAIKKGSIWVKTLFVVISSIMIIKLLIDIYT